MNSKQEAKKITLFIKDTFEKQGFKNVAIGLSGGIDSSLCLRLLSGSLNSKNIYVAHLYYFKSQIDQLSSFLKELKIPKKNIYNISIKKSVDQIKKTCNLTQNSKDYKVRLGNIMARIRMVFLYDLAKNKRALVCGTENKSEHLLGYFTRFGDEASDFEPIRHLYKTEVLELAKYLNLPKEIILQAPTAGLWLGQTDEKDFGFTYQEADMVLNFYFDQKKSLEEIKYPNAKKIITRAIKNSFKHNLPYTP